MSTLIQKAKNKISELVQEAEINIIGSGKGEEKLEYVVDKLMGFYNLPFVPDSLEKPLWMWLFKSAIDQAVSLLTQKGLINKK